MSENEHNDKRLRIDTIESRYGSHKLTILDERMKDIFNNEITNIDQSKESELTFLDETYRLFGVSSFLVKRKHLTCLRFDTCYHGRYYEIFYVFLEINRKKSVIPHVVAHTLPAFMPMKDWEDKFLSIDVQSFSQCVSLYLNSFIARIEQVKVVERDYSKDVEIVASDSLCSVNLQFKDFTIKLLYKLEERYPYSVERMICPTPTVYPQNNPKRIGLTERNLELLKEKTLDDAIRSIVNTRSYYVFINKQTTIHSSYSSSSSSSSSSSLTVSIVPL